MTDKTFKAMSDQELWETADARATELATLLHDPEQRGKSIQGLPYWFFIGMCVGALTTITRELSERSAK